METLKRTTINIDPSIFAQIRRLAAKADMSQTNLIKLLLVDGLRRYTSKKTNNEKFNFPTTGNSGLQDGLDLSNRSELIDLLDNNKLNL